MSAAETIIARLGSVQAYGKGWRAPCPSCGGKSRKLSISEREDGVVLMQCFGGCTVLAVLASIGLRIGDLFPVRPTADTAIERKRRAQLARESQWGAALEMLAVESTVTWLAAEQLKRREPLTSEDSARLTLAHERIGSARQILRDYPRWKPKEATA